jgi:type IV secretory pathway VirD2 relaxase
MSFDEALTFRWYPVAREVFPYNWFFHEQLGRAIRVLKADGDPQELELGLDRIAFEE